ncbi:MAG: hypothetical protein V2A58_01895, partial [Planctomycetota bacterium]
IFAIVAVPTIVVAILKLRRRNMSALLEASGWAVNRRMRLTASLGRLFTRVPPFREDAEKRRFDLARSFLTRVSSHKRD